MMIDTKNSTTLESEIGAIVNAKLQALGRIVHVKDSWYDLS